MDQSDPYPNNNYHSAVSISDENEQDLWDEDEEIELGSDENELFLRDEYVKPISNHVLPFRVATPTTTVMGNHRNGFNKHYVSQKSGQSSTNGNDTKIETFQVDDSGRGSPTPSSAVYQIPNYDQFAGNLAPSSPHSVLVSFIIIFVILFVTIVPKVIPKSQSIDDPYDEDVIESSTSRIAQISKQSVHTDARCKCICPPLLSKASNNTGTTSKSSDQRRLYVGNTLPDQCNCNNIVRAHFKDTEVSFKAFCDRCDCRYQSRNTTTIKRNVVFFIAVLIGLVLYLLVQYLLKHLKITRRSLSPHLRWLSHQMTESN